MWCIGKEYLSTPPVSLRSVFVALAQALVALAVIGQF